MSTIPLDDEAWEVPLRLLYGHVFEWLKRCGCTWRYASPGRYLLRFKGEAGEQGSGRVRSSLGGREGAGGRARCRIPYPILFFCTISPTQTICRPSYKVVCYNTLQGHSGAYLNVAYDHIQDRRAGRRVPRGPGGLLHDYVPFHFGPRPPMLLPIHSGRVPGYTGGQPPILHLVVGVQDLVAAGLPFVFTDGHGTMAYTRYYETLERLDQVDFSLMKEKYWHDTLDDPNRKWRRNAEFLVHERVPWAIVKGIGVLNETMKTRVDGILQTHQQATPVVIRPKWYY